MPALPLDGGRIVFSFGYYFFSLSSLVRILCSMGIVVGIGFLGLAIYGLLFHEILNCSILIVGGYLIYCSCKSREQLLFENLYTLIEEAGKEVLRIRRVNVYRVPLDMPLLRLIPLLGRRCGCEFVTSMNDQELRISEQLLCRYLFEQPFSTIHDIFIQKNNR